MKKGEKKMDWKRKLTSRKFWAAVAEFVAMLIVALKGSQETATQVVALIMAGAGVIAYIVGEGLIDAAGMESTQVSFFPGYAEEQKEKPPAGEEEQS